MIVPEIPLFTDDVRINIDLIVSYLYNLQDALSNLDTQPLDSGVDTGWSTSGVVTDKSLSVGDTLAQTQHVLGTLIAVLISKGILSA